MIVSEDVNIQFSDSKLSLGSNHDSSLHIEASENIEIDGAHQKSLTHHSPLASRSKTIPSKIEEHPKL